MPPGIDAVMRIEPAVLDGDEGFRQVGRQVLQRDIGAGHFAALRQYAAVEARDLDGRRPLRNFKRLDRRQVRARPDHGADDRDRRPTGRARRPSRTAGTGRRARCLVLCACGSRGRPSACARAEPHRHRRPARPVCVWQMISSAFHRRPPGHGPAVEAQIRQRRAEPELRLLASAALPSSPRHTPTPAPVPPQPSVRGLRVGYPKVNAGLGAAAVPRFRRPGGDQPAKKSAARTAADLSNLPRHNSSRPGRRLPGSGRTVPSARR